MINLPDVGPGCPYTFYIYQLSSAAASTENAMKYSFYDWGSFVSVSDKGHHKNSVVENRTFLQVQYQLNKTVKEIMIP